MLGFALAAWLMAPIAVKTFARASFFEMTAPVAAASSYVNDLQKFWALRLHSKDDLIEAGRDMARINSKYSLSAQQTGELQAEVERLNALLKMPPIEGYRYEHARVAQRDFSSWWQRMVIRRVPTTRYRSAPRWCTAGGSSGGSPRSTRTPPSSSSPRTRA